jgi:outer membrane lipoprotein SlyB
MSARRRLLVLAAAILSAPAVAQAPPQTVPAPLLPPPLPETSPTTLPTAPQRHPVQPGTGEECDRCGTIQSIQRATAKDQWTPLGTVSASPLGAGDGVSPSAVTMYQIGKGFSKQGTVLVGAAGGAAYNTRPRELNAPRWEVTIRMDGGGTRSVTQNYEPMLREGDRVRILGTQLELMQ